ncbi:methyltransferase FkbM [Tepidicaulis marinus]|uniref:Methyltransferase FkbM n=1 Tax=Tepidicaulis marinus TaxID=1333998 RepID=A0A081BDP6_9HYPH|nr:FkbM family methyltransferase [Tepidicaulis marinus]GAK46164.1 methyltransferase FkbM [Tepidicaulis marinus]
MNAASEAIIFDRTNASLSTPDLRSLIHVRALQTTHKILRPFGYIGISRLHNMISKITRPTTMTMVREGRFCFRFPSNDYYWNRLLDPSWSYEPEIDVVLARFADVPYIFLDLGANFGFWSARVASGLYGEHPVVAVEASEFCFQLLKLNVSELNAHIHHRAIDSVSDKRISLFGSRHAGFSIDENWYGASKNVVNDVVSVTIDDLLALENLDADQKPVIIKLDVEGVELRALQGASKAVAGKTAFIIEDADRSGLSDAVRYAIDELGMTIFSIEDGHFNKLSTLEELTSVNANKSQIQATGLNLIATKSPFWIERLTGSNSERARP